MSRFCSGGKAKKQQQTQIYQKVIIPKGMVNPAETTIVEIPLKLQKQPVVVAKRKVNGQNSDEDLRAQSGAPQYCQPAVGLATSASYYNSYGGGTCQPQTVTMCQPPQSTYLPPQPTYPSPQSMYQPPQPMYQSSPQVTFQTPPQNVCQLPPSGVCHPPPQASYLSQPQAPCSPPQPPPPSPQPFYSPPPQTPYSPPQSTCQPQQMYVCTPPSQQPQQSPPVRSAASTLKYPDPSQLANTELQELQALKQDLEEFQKARRRLLLSTSTLTTKSQPVCPGGGPGATPSQYTMSQCSPTMQTMCRPPQAMPMRAPMRAPSPSPSPIPHPQQQQYMQQYMQRQTPMTPPRPQQRAPPPRPPPPQIPITPPPRMQQPAPQSPCTPPSGSQQRVTTRYSHTKVYRGVAQTQKPPERAADLTTTAKDFNLDTCGCLDN